MRPQESADVVAIQRVWAAYADVVSRRAWPELVPLFTGDAVIDLHIAGREPMQLVGPRAVGEFIGQALSSMSFFQFVPLNSVVEMAADGASATGRLWIQEHRQFADSGRFTQVWGRYEDRFAKVDGRWVMTYRHYRTLARTGTGSGGDLDLAD